MLILPLTINTFVFRRSQSPISRPREFFPSTEWTKLSRETKIWEARILWGIDQGLPAEKTLRQLTLICTLGQSEGLGPAAWVGALRILPLRPRAMLGTSDSRCGPGITGTQAGKPAPSTSQECKVFINFTKIFAVHILYTLLLKRVMRTFILWLG